MVYYEDDTELSPSLCSFSAPIETSLIASERVYGRSLLALKIGLNILFRKLFRVLFALRIRIDEIVQGSVELLSTWGLVSVCLY